MDVLTIKTEGKRIDRVRNIERLWLEVVSISPNGCGIEGHNVLGYDLRDDGTFGPVPTRIEIYADRLGAVLDRVRTEAQRQVHERAVESAKILTDEWIREKGPAFKRALDMKTPEERERTIRMTCNIRPEHEYRRFGYRSGLPPLDSCKVIHAQTGETMDAREWQKLDAGKRKAWMVDAPATPHNQAQRANEHLADTMGSVFENVLSKIAAAQQQPRGDKQQR